MKTNSLLNKLAPCGLSCEKCFAYKSSDIKKHSIALRECLGNFDKHAARFSVLLDEPVFNLYPYFKTHLNFFANTDCEGCRKNTCKLFKACRVRECAKEKKIDFCYLCPEFPCNNTGFDENLETRWLQINARMKQVGIDIYYEETKDDKRYL